MPVAVRAQPGVQEEKEEEEGGRGRRTMATTTRTEAEQNGKRSPIFFFFYLPWQACRIRRHAPCQQEWRIRLAMFAVFFFAFRRCT